MPKIDSGNVALHYQQQGTGPDVVLLHAFTSNLSVWMLTNIVEQLAADFRVTLYDLRGHGASSVPPNGYTSADMVQDFAALHGTLGLGPAWLVGHSFGGVIGMHAALLHPDLVRGVVLCDSYFPGLAEIEPNMQRALPWVELRELLHSAGAEIGETVDFSRLFRVIAALDAEQMAAIKQIVGPPGTRWLSKLGQLAPTTAGEEAFQPAGLTAEAIGSIRQPVIALYDEESAFLATCRFLESRLADCTVDYLPGATHLAPVQNSAEFVQKVRHYLRKLQGLEEAEVCSSG